MRLLALPDLRARGIKYSRVHLARLELAGQFPRRVRLSGNRVAWVEDEVSPGYPTVSPSATAFRMVGTTPQKQSRPPPKDDP
jgi:prophage regulatory protein